MDRQLSKNIAASTAHRKSRDENAAFVRDNLLSHDLIALALDTNDRNHFKACWILELVLEQDLALLKPQLDAFCNALPTWTNDSAVRSIAKIALFCAKRLRTQPDFLSDQQISAITEACFQWIISDQKVAAKAYAILCLYETGKRLDWVYPELIPVLQHGFTGHSAAYKSVAKKVLAKIQHG